MRSITALLLAAALTLMTIPAFAQDDETIDESLEFLCEEAGGTWEDGECK